MKKVIFIPILFACIVLGCSDDPTNTDTTYGDTCTLTQNYDKKVSFITDGFGYNNLLIDCDIREDRPPIDSSDYNFYGLFGENLDGSYYLELGTGTSNGVKVGDEYHHIKIESVVPKSVSGEYDWKGSNLSGSNGITFSKVGYPYGIYHPISGKTLIRFYKNDSTGKMDSIYGAFCGVVQNELGERLNIHDGKFYLTRYQ